ncbi:MAG: hemerythrin domain-containing protein [Betaproteobacteria bacterium]|nr:hemerythrin domain-containing protein [Betaproteobacteria bacterium]
MPAHDPRRSAIERIKSEHHSLGAVLHALQKFTHALRDERAGPDFELLAAMLYYIDAFPERFHHPKEDQHLFSALRRRTARLNEVLDTLQGEHIRSGQLMGQLEKALVHYAGGDPDGLEGFCAAVDAYAALTYEHMRTEEQELLAAAPEYLRPEDWQAIDRAFGDHDDPMFGDKPTEAFRRQRLRIISLLPVKLRPLFRDSDA